ncbi:MAG: hypothetical protein ACE5J1_01150 [Nitrospiria bacterium]
MPPKVKKGLPKKKKTLSRDALLEKTKELELLHRITESISSNLDL